MATMATRFSLSSRKLPVVLFLLLAGAVAMSAWGGILAERNGSWTLLALGIVLGIVAALAILFGGMHANGRLREIRGTLRRVTEGDLGARVSLASKIAELDAIARSVNGLGESNSSLVVELRDGALALEREVASFQRSFGRIRGQAERSRDATSTVAAAMEELSVGTGTIGNETQEVQGAAQETLTLVKRLDEMSGATSQAITRQFQSIRDVENRMTQARASSEDLERRSKEIANAAGSITDVAKQLRLLALNASIEAVKAGETGRGFSIVAQEVKDLADKVGGMASSIQAQVAAVGEGTRKVAVDMMASVEAVGSMKADGEHSVEVANSQAILAREAMVKLDDTNRNIAAISRTLEESRVALGEIGRTGAELESRAGATVAALESMETGLGDLDLLSRSFRITVQDFRVREPFFPWSDDLSVGVPRMDDQHRVLLRLINRVADLAASGGSGAAIRTILGQLVEYTRFHFGDEEKLMQTHAYDGLGAHHEIHVKFMNEVVSLLKKTGEGESIDADKVLGMLKDWLIRHIQGTDKVYGAYIRKRTDMPGA